MADVTIVPGAVIFIGGSTLGPSPTSPNQDVRIGIPGQRTLSTAGMVNPSQNISQPQNTSASVSFSKSNPNGPAAGDLFYTVVDQFGQTVVVDVNGNPVQPFAQVSKGAAVNVNGNP